MLANFRYLINGHAKLCNLVLPQLHHMGHQSRSSQRLSFVEPTSHPFLLFLSHSFRNIDNG